MNRSEWAAPTFIIPKKDGTVRFISDFRELNLRLKRKPFPLPNIQDLLLKLEGFTYGTSLDLNMGYYHIELTPNSKRYCTIVLPWGKYEYQRLPMGLCNSPDIFQEKMSSLMADLEFVRVYIDDLLVIGKGSWIDHLEQLETVLQRLKEKGLRINARKSSFGKHELEYLGYWITRKGIQPIPKKVKAIINIQSPNNRKELRRFIGMINFYRDMWRKRAEVLAPLTALCSTKVKFEWTLKHEKAFKEIKQIITKEVMLSYPDFNKPFEIYTDASQVQLGSVISQENRPIAFYSRKLSPAQTRYTTIEKELLAIVETLKEYKNILLGQKIKIYTDHMNLTYKKYTSDRVMRWRLIIEEFGPELIYVQGQKNIIADSLSRLAIAESATQEITYEQLLMQNAETFAQEKESLPRNIYPLNFKLIAREQSLDEELLVAAKRNVTGNYQLKDFHGGGKTIQMLCYLDKIVIPKSLQLRTVEWYHTSLCHPGLSRTEETIKQNLIWKNLRQTVREVCKKCPTCQRTKNLQLNMENCQQKKLRLIHGKNYV